MDLSKLSLDPQQKETVETILADDDMEFQEKLMYLTSLKLDNDSYVKIKAYLTKKEMDKEKQKAAADFVPLIKDAKQTLVLFYLKQKKYDVIAKEVAKQSPECQQAFREFMKQKGLNVPTMVS